MSPEIALRKIHSMEKFKPEGDGRLVVARLPHQGNVTATARLGAGEISGFPSKIKVA